MILDSQDYKVIFDNKIAPEIEELGFELQQNHDSTAFYLFKLPQGQSFSLQINAYYYRHGLNTFQIILELFGDILFETDAKHKKGATYLEEDDILRAVDQLIRFLTEN